MHYPVAYLLVSHGSHDPRPQLAVDALTDRFAQKVQHAGWQDLANVGLANVGKRGAIADQQSRVATNSHTPIEVIETNLALPLVGTAYLECSPLPLHQQIEQFSEPLRAALPTDRITNQASKAIRASSVLDAQVPKLVVLPLFLLPGVHVMEDLPREIALAQEALGASIAIETRPAIGSHPKLYRLVTECMATQPVEAWVLLAHGSRRLDANHPVEAMAARLGAVTAYWSVLPSLESRLQELVKLGIRSIGILPYFLFAGGITDAIAQTVETLSQQFPVLSLHLAPPLATSSELTDLLVDLAQDQERRLKDKS